MDGRKELVVNILANLASQHPNDTWAKVPKSTTTYEAGYRCISYSQLQHAVDILAHHIVDALGPGQAFPTLAYFGLWDPRFTMLILAAHKAGYKLLLPSPNSPVESVAALLRQVECSTILFAPEAQAIPVLSQIRAQGSFSELAIPSLSSLLSTPATHFPYTKTFDSACHEPLVVLHTSGSTGQFKPITWTQQWAADFIQQMTREPPAGFQSQEQMWQGRTLLSLVPPFHSASQFGMLMTLSRRTVYVYPLPTSTLSLETVVNVLKKTSCDVVCVVPHVINQLGSDSSALDFVASRVNLLTYAGGLASPTAAEKVTSKIKIFSTYGHTENGIVPCIRPATEPGSWDRTLWRSMMFHPCNGAAMRKTTLGEDTSDLRELVFEWNSDPEAQQPVFSFLPKGVTEWATKDLFAPDPDHPGFWIYHGRLDDWIVFSSGAKFDPSQYELAINAHPAVRSAVMVGTGRPRPALVIEPAQDIEDRLGARDEFVGTVWPAIENANKIAGPFGSVARDLMLVIRPDKPLPRTGKGSIARKALADSHAEDLDQLYKRAS